MTNRLDRLSNSIAARQWGQMAAIYNEGWHTNPYPVGSYFWILWGESYNRELARLVRVAEETEKGQK